MAPSDAVFADRRDAGRQLGAHVQKTVAGEPGAVVLGLPRGGVPVADEVAAALDAPLDVMLVRKLGVPHQPELAFGAIASGGARVINRDVILGHDLSSAQIERVVLAEQDELDRRERVYRGSAPPLPVAGRTAVVVDDGLATGATMRVAVQAVSARGAARVIVAVPVGAAETCAALGDVADQVVCLWAPVAFVALSLWYRDFSPTSDAEVVALLRRQA